MKLLIATVLTIICGVGLTLSVGSCSSGLAFNNGNRFPNIRVQFVNSRVGWIIGPRLLQTTDGGRTWNVIRTAGYGTFEAESIGFGHRIIQFINTNIGVQLDLSAIAKTTDGNATWSDEFQLPKRDNREVPSGSLFFLSPEEGWMVCEVVYHTSDGGRNWKQLSLTPRGVEHRQRDLRIAPTIANFIPALWFTDRENGLMARMDGEVYRTSDGGRTWNMIWTVEKRILDIFFINSQDGWIAGDGGLMARTADGGRTWSPVSTPTKADLTSVFFISKQIGWAVGSRSTILYTKDGGMTWKAGSVSGLLGSPPLASVSFADELHGWAVGGNSDPTYPSLIAPSNIVLATDDGGQTWKEIHP